MPQSPKVVISKVCLKFALKRILDWIFTSLSRDVNLSKTVCLVSLIGLYFEIWDWLCFIAGLPRAPKLICINDHAKKLMTFGLEHNSSHLDFVLFNKKLMDFQVISLNITLEFKLYSERKSYLWLLGGLWTKGEIICFRSFRIPWTFRSFDLTDRK